MLLKSNSDIIVECVCSGIRAGYVYRISDFCQMICFQILTQFAVGIMVNHDTIKWNILLQTSHSLVILGGADLSSNPLLESPLLVDPILSTTSGLLDRMVWPTTNITIPLPLLLPLLLLLLLLLLSVSWTFSRNQWQISVKRRACKCHSSGDFHDEAEPKTVVPFYAVRNAAGTQLWTLYIGI